MNPTRDVRLANQALRSQVRPFGVYDLLYILKNTDLKKKITDKREPLSVQIIKETKCKFQRNFLKQQQSKLEEEKNI